MTIWAIADLHLAFGAPEKNMEFFGPLWAGYTDKIAANWHSLIQSEDLVLIAGDISWAMRLEQAMIDLAWIDKLPGTKVILRGNHDYWWPSSAKLAQALPPSIRFIHNNALEWQGVALGGTRLWDTEEYNFNAYVHFQENPRAKSKAPPTTPSEKPDSGTIFERELKRLEMSLQALDPAARLRIALTHYPPISADLAPSRAAAILEKYKIDICVFGHLHNLKKGASLFGTARGVRYLLTSCDYLDFKPIKIWPAGS